MRPAFARFPRLILLREKGWSVWPSLNTAKNPAVLLAIKDILRLEHPLLASRLEEAKDEKLLRVLRNEYDSDRDLKSVEFGEALDRPPLDHPWLTVNSCRQPRYPKRT